MGNLTRQAQNPVAIRCRTAWMRWLAEGQASKVERTATAPSYRPARRADEAGRVARRHGTVAAQAPTSMTGRSGMGHEPRHAGGDGTQPSTSGEGWGEASKHGGEHQASRDERRTARRHEERDDRSQHRPTAQRRQRASKQDEQARRIPHEPVIRIVSSGIEYEMTRQQRRRRNPARSEASNHRPTGNNSERTQ